MSYSNINDEVKMKKAPSFRRCLFYAFLFLVGNVLMDAYGYTKLLKSQHFQSQYFELYYLGSLLAAFLVASGQFVATVFYSWHLNRDRAFFYLFQFMLWLFVTWLTFVIHATFAGIGFHSVPIHD
jgi:hypothetical protein